MKGKFPVVDTGAQSFDNIQPDPGSRGNDITEPTAVRPNLHLVSTPKATRSTHQSASSKEDKKCATLSNLSKPLSSIMVRPRRQRLVGGCSPLKLVDLRGSSKQLRLNTGKGNTSSRAEGGSARRNQTCSNVPSQSVPSSHMIRQTRRRLLDGLYLPVKRPSDSHDPKRMCIQTKTATAVKKRNLDTSGSAKLGGASNDAQSQKDTKRKKVESSASIPAVQKQTRRLLSGGRAKRSSTESVPELLTSSSKRRKCTSHFNEPGVQPSALQTSRQSTETQTDGLRKGPPAKGVLILRELQQKIRQSAYLQEAENDDSDYVPSEDDSEVDNETDSSCGVVEEDTGDSVEMTASVGKAAYETDITTWQHVRGLHKQFAQKWADQVADHSRTAVAGPDLQPVDFYSLFLDSDVIDLMVKSTNAYANKSRTQRNLKPHARAAQWSDTDGNETKQFIGLITWMGIVNMPSIECYWRQYKLYRNMKLQV